MRRFVRNLLIIVAVCGIIVVAVQVLLASGDRAEYERRLAALREAGQPVEFADLNEDVPDEENGFVAMRAAVALRPRYFSFVQGVMQEDAERNPFDPAAHEQTLDLLREATRRPHYVPEFPVAPDPNVHVLPVSNVLRIARFLGWGIRTGPLDHAADLARLKLAVAERCIEPFMVGFHVSISAADSIIRDLQALQERPGFDAVAFRAAVDPDVARAAARRGPPPRALAQERIYGVLAVTHWLAGDDTLGSGGGWKDEWRHTWLGRRLVYRDAVAYLDVVQSAIDQCPTGAREALAVAARLEATELDQDYTMARLISRHIAMTLRNYTVHVANLRMVRVAMAILENRQVHGDWPQRLDASLPLNPFTNAPFEYERTEQGARMRYPDMDRYWEFRAHPG